MRFKKREKLTGTKVLTGCPVLLVTLKLFDWTAQTALICDITSNYTEINMLLWLCAYAGSFFFLQNSFTQTTVPLKIQHLANID